MHSVMNQLCTWLQLAGELHIPAGTFGAFGHVWQHEGVQTLIRDHAFCKSHHRACHFGLKLDPKQTEPSKICFVFLCNVKTPSHLCKCSVPQHDHKLDWSAQNMSIARRPRHRLQQEIASAVLSVFLEKGMNHVKFSQIHRAHYDTPDSKTNYHTEEPQEDAPKVSKNSGSNTLGASASTADSIRVAVHHTTCACCQLEMPLSQAYCTLCEEPLHGQEQTVGGPSVAPSSCFPTEERIRQKDRLKKLKEAGLKPQPRKVVVEEHFDDCGTDLSGLAPFLNVDDEPKKSPNDAALYHAVCMMEGFDLMEVCEHTYHAADMETALNVLSSLGSQVDLVEICGGAARTSRISIRRHLKVGKNFDLITHCDLNDPAQQQLVMQYFEEHKPLVAVMSPRCSPFGSHSNLNYSLNPQGWERTYQDSAPHGRFCGELALYQDRSGRYFFLEQPQGSWLYEEYPWNIVCYLPSVFCETIHQRMLGQLGPHGGPAKKSTDLIANHTKLLEPFANCRCDGSHVHDSLDGGRAKTCETWTWEFAKRVSDGIIRLKEHLSSSIADTQAAFPARGTSTGEGEAEQEDNQAWRKCPGCNGRQSKYDPRHSRVRGECKWPDITPIIWKCPGCARHKPYGHPDHTHREDCKHSVIAHRLGVPRAGRHPRSPSKPASASVSTDLQPQLADGTDLGEEDEARNAQRSPDVQHIPQNPPAEILRLCKCTSWTIACNGDPVLVEAEAADFAFPNEEHKDHPYRTTWAKFGKEWYQLELLKKWEECPRPHILPGIATPLITIFHPNSNVDITPFLTASTDIVPADSHRPTPRVSSEKNRRTYQEASVGTEHPGDWSRFNVGNSLCALTNGSPDTQMRELRKLHLRWWHCGPETMRRVLKAAGLPNSILDKVVSVTDTCRECRMWARPAHETIPTLRMTTAFNEHVEADIMFYREYAIFHLICCGTRWHAATVVRSKHEEELFAAVHKIWISIHGPTQQLITDGELGLTNPTAEARLKRLGVSLKVRAPGQHARFVERRGAILRTTMHCMESQLIREGVPIDMDILLSEATFSGNVLVHIGGVTPYQCVYGRAPAMLPPMPDEQSTSNDEASEQSQAARHRIRTAALEAMIQSTSLARTSRALRSRGIAATEIKYEPGDLIDYHRPTSSKDASGWHGPTKVLEYKPEDGIVVIDLHGKPRPCRLQDVRHTLFAHVSSQVFVTMTVKSALNIIQEFVNKQRVRTYVTLGIVANDQGALHLAQSTHQHSRVLMALNHLLENAWCFDECHAVRLGKSCKTLPRMPRSTHSTLLYWNTNKSSAEPLVFAADDSRISMLEIVGCEYQSFSFVQLLHNSDNPSGLCDSVDATAASHGCESHGQEVIADAHSDRLSTIPEGSNEGADSENQDPDFVAFMSQNFAVPRTPENTAAIHDLWALYQDTVTSPEEIVQDSIPMIYVPPDNVYHSESVHQEIVQTRVSPDIEEPFITEMLVLPQLTNCFIGSQQHLQTDDTLSIRIYNTVTKAEVVKRASDILTKEEIIENQEAVNAAIVEEFKVWTKYECFKMVPRRGAENIIDSRFVCKWKVKDPTRPYESRIIRMRMALRGFKEWCADSLDTYAATGSKISQRLLLSETACHPDWSFLSIDINKAFLQGVTYKELAEATGQAERVVHFTPPPGSAQLLRNLPEFANYDERYHVLKCLRPGTGCKDAPRAFSMKLSKATRAPEVGLKPLAADPECEVKHRNGKLVLILVKHVDDLKIAGEESEVQNLLSALEKIFGPSERNNNNFTCVGIKHTRDPDGTITLDQDEYISALKPIQHPDLVGRPLNEACTDVVTHLYWSLLGAVAYTMLTQHWVNVYIIALQRQTHNPQYQHIRKLNSLLRILQKQKAKIVYPSMQCSSHILAYSDASFCKESESKGYGVRGTVILRVGKRDGVERCHLLDASSQSLKLVTRSTFSSETLAAVGTVDSLIPVAISLTEILHKPLSPEDLRRFREGTLQHRPNLKITVAVDAMNLFQAWTGTSVKLPTEKSLFPHLAWLRDVVKCAPTHVLWVDTRDMLADPMTKGTILRTAILQAMNGFFKISHESREHAFGRHVDE